MIDFLTMPDPTTHTWDQCLAYYQEARQITLRNLKALRVAAAAYVEEQKALVEPRIEDYIALEDRAEYFNGSADLYRQYLVWLRDYYWLIAVCHSKVTVAQAQHFYLSRGRKNELVPPKSEMN